MPRPTVTSSGSSSPAPPQDDDEQAEREHQQEVDLHLATSMSLGGELMASRSRSRSGGSEIAGRSQAEQDVRFFEGSASPPRRDNVPSLSQRSPASPNAAAAARFYRQNKRRTLSDTSIDSQPGLIDHRGSQSSMPFPFQRKLDGRQGSPRSQAKSGVSRKRSSRLRSEVQTDERSAVLDRRSSNDEDGSNDEDVSMEDGSRQPPRRRKNTLASNLTAQRQARDAEYAAEDADNDNAESSVVIDVDEDEEAVTDHRGDMRRGLLNRHNSARSQRSQLSGRLGTRAAALRTDDDDGMTFTPSLSRRPSDAAKVEEDVCYPMLEMREVDMEEREGGGPRAHADGRGSPRQDEHHRSRYHDQGNHPGLPGVLPNFPFPFDFGALEEFCGDERRSNGVAIPRTKGSGDNYSHGRTPPGSKALSFSPEQEPSVLRRRNGEVPSRRQRKLSESTGHGVGRYQRKLALFEGNSNGAVDGPKYLSPPATSKTPLLADGGKMSTGFGAVDTSSRTMTGSNEKARPYRFSFYSNALPSTIHARSLAELPADGQSFEELFVGRQPDTPPEDWEASVPDAMGNGFHAMLPARQPGVDSSGKNTPDVSALGHATSDGKLGAQSNTASRTGLNAYSTKPRTNIMRSNEDAEANTWWLDVLNPTDAEMKVLGKVFGIHPLTIEDILMEETREKIELFRNYYLVCFRSFDQDPYSPTYLEPLNMYIIVMREGTLSFHFRGTPHPQNVRRRIKQLKDFINVTSDWISYALIDDITDAFGPLIQNIEYEVDSIDELVLILKDAEQSDMLRRIGTCRKKVMGLLRLMGNKADVVKGLAKRCNENWSVAPKSDIGLYLSDIQDHLITMTQNLNHYEKILSRSHSNYLAQISIEMTDANNQINDVLSKLTALGTVLIPMNLVTGLWGMNTNVPGQDVDNLNWFFGIVGCLLAFALLGGYLTFRAFRK